MAYPLRYEWDAMNKVILWLVALSLVVGAIAFAEAQQPRKVPQIGFLVPDSQSTASIRTKAFRQGLHELKYVEGQNIVIEYRFAEGKIDRVRSRRAYSIHLAGIGCTSGLCILRGDNSILCLRRYVSSAFVTS